MTAIGFLIFFLGSLVPFIRSDYYGKFNDDWGPLIYGIAMMIGLILMVIGISTWMWPNMP